MSVDFTDPLAAALWLAGQGFAVHPLDHPSLPVCAGIKTQAHDPAACTERGKHPATKWSERATPDVEQVVAWYTGRSRNVGVACAPSGLLVVDEDVPGDFPRYTDSIGEQIPDTLTVQTGKGRHYYFRQPDGRQLGNGVGQLRDYGVDVRGRGGYVVAPGSVHASGVLYAPLDADVPPADPPAWLLTALTPVVPTSSARPARASALPAQRGRRVKILAGLVRVVLSAQPPAYDQAGRRIRKGDRHNALLWAACRAAEHVHAGVLHPAEVRDALLEAARRIGVRDGEADAAIEWASENVNGAGT